MRIGNREPGLGKTGPSEARSALARLADFPFARTRSRTRGFTLIELMAVILLLAIALSAVTFSFSKSLRTARVAAASRDLVAALRYTRGQAIVKGKQEVLVLNLDDNSYSAPGKTAVKLPAEMTMRLTTAERELTGGNSGGIRFFADGSSTGGHISVLQGSREWRIDVAWLTGDIALDEHPE